MDFTVVGEVYSPSIIFTSAKWGMDLSCNLQLSSSYYNPKISCWEPFMESFAIEAKVNYPKETQHPQIYFEVNANRPINFNVSNEMV